jgi:hypothetical protein
MGLPLAGLKASITIHPFNGGRHRISPGRMGSDGRMPNPASPYLKPGIFKTGENHVDQNAAQEAR